MQVLQRYTSLHGDIGDGGAPVVEKPEDHREVTGGGAQPAGGEQAGVRLPTQRLVVHVVVVEKVGGRVIEAGHRRRGQRQRSVLTLLRRLGGVEGVAAVAYRGPITRSNIRHRTQAHAQCASRRCRGVPADLAPLRNRTGTPQRAARVAARNRSGRYRVSRVSARPSAQPTWPASGDRRASACRTRDTAGAVVADPSDAMTCGSGSARTDQAHRGRQCGAELLDSDCGSREEEGSVRPQHRRHMPGPVGGCVRGSGAGRGAAVPQLVAGR